MGQVKSEVIGQNQCHRVSNRDKRSPRKQANPVRRIESGWIGCLAHAAKSGVGRLNRIAQFNFTQAWSGVHLSRGAGTEQCPPLGMGHRTAEQLLSDFSNNRQMSNDPRWCVSMSASGTKHLVFREIVVDPGKHAGLQFVQYDFVFKHQFNLLP